MAKREKKVVHAGVSSEQMEAAFAEYALADAKVAKINAIMDAQMTNIREKYADDVAKHTAEKESAFELMQTYAVENKDVLFAKRKSIESAHGIIGFRTGTPKLKTLKGFTWGAVANMVKEFLPGYLRVSEEVAKDKLLADRDVPEVNSQFRKIGISVVQDETFYVELKKEENGS
jgi:Mu-like prophage host-nuclease inhibitor protein Gam